MKRRKQRLWHCHQYLPGVYSRYWLISAPGAHAARIWIWDNVAGYGWVHMMGARLVVQEVVG